LAGLVAYKKSGKAKRVHLAAAKKRCGKLFEQISEAAGEQAGETRLEGAARGDVAAGREFVNDAGQHFRETGSGVAVAQAGLLRELRHLIMAKCLRDLFGRDGLVLPRRDPRGKNIAHAATLEFLLHPADAAVLGDHAHHCLHEHILTAATRAAAAESGTDDVAEKTHNFIFWLRVGWLVSQIYYPRFHCRQTEFRWAKQFSLKRAPVSGVYSWNLHSDDDAGMSEPN
jgi:hypothetical protein